MNEAGHPGFWRQPHPLLPRFLLVFVVITAFLAVAIGIFYRIESGDRLALILALEKQGLHFQKALVQARVRQASSDIALLAGAAHLRELLQEPAASRRDLAAEQAEQYVAFLRRRPSYERVQLMDAAGMEILHVDRRLGRPVASAPGELRPQLDRAWFNGIMQRAAGEVFIAAVGADARVDADDSSPGILVGTPLVDADGRRRGALVLACSGARLFAQPRDTGAPARTVPVLLNGDGFWIYGADDKSAWDSPAVDKAHRALAASMPSAWKQIAGTDSGQFVGPDGVFTFAALRPGQADADLGAPPAAANGPTWTLVFHLPPSYLDAESRRLLGHLLLLGGSLLLPALAVSWVIAHAGLRQKQYKDRLQRLAHFDALTGLANRTLFADRLDQALKQAGRYGYPCALLFLDLDNFKPVNDSHGHETGDMLLRRIAQRLRKQVRSSDTVARVGGDEFTIVLTRISRAGDAGTVARQIITSLAQPFYLKDAELHITASIGISLCPQDGLEGSVLLEKADVAMYAAKEAGRNTWRYYSSPPQSTRDLPGSVAEAARSEGD